MFFRICKLDRRYSIHLNCKLWVVVLNNLFSPISLQHIWYLHLIVLIPSELHNGIFDGEVAILSRLSIFLEQKINDGRRRKVKEARLNCISKKDVCIQRPHSPTSRYGARSPETVRRPKGTLKIPWGEDPGAKRYQIFSRA
jgi:hypothetical protein